jgi:hypothetical protein
MQIMFTVTNCEEIIMLDFGGRGLSNLAETYVNYINKTVEKHKDVYVMNQLL